jgi:hypothetical protein
MRHVARTEQPTHPVFYPEGLQSGEDAVERLEIPFAYSPG